MAKKKRTRRQPKKAGVNRSQSIRDFLKKKPQSTNREVKEALAEQGIEASDNLISSARRTLGIAAKRSGKRGSRNSPMRAAKPLRGGNETVPVSSLVAAQRFAAEVGGVDSARRLLDVLTVLQK